MSRDHREAATVLAILAFVLLVAVDHPARFVLALIVGVFAAALAAETHLSRWVDRHDATLRDDTVAALRWCDSCRRWGHEAGTDDCPMEVL